MVGWSVGRRGVGRWRALSDGEQQLDGSFYFFLEPPDDFGHRLACKVARRKAKHYIAVKLFGGFASRLFQ